MTTESTSPLILTPGTSRPQEQVAGTDVTFRALELLTEELAVDTGLLTDETQVADLGLDSLMSLVMSIRFREELGLETRDLIPFFWLPAMRVVIGHGIIESWSEAEPEEHGGLWGPGKSGVREIRLGGPFKGCNGDEGVSRYITYCANLEIFE